jgi:Rhodopirellula transposase DDE domain
MAEVEAIQRRFELLARHLDERTRRLLAASEAMAIGRGGASTVARATGVSRRVIGAGIKELSDGPTAGAGRIRRPGGGRKRTIDTDPTLRGDLERLVEPVTRGDPESPLRWTCKSVRKLAEELRGIGHAVSHQLVAELLHELEYSLQANRKVLEGSQHPDRDAQFEYLNDQVQQQVAAGEPAISVDAKKKELVGPFKNGGRELRPKGQPEPVRVHDFVDKDLGRATPYGVYDLARNQGWVTVGIDHDTAAFAVASIQRWWQTLGQPTYPEATSLLITADGGGSNGSRLRLWKLELQRFADESGLELRVCHLPPGTSKWNKIEHRLFSYITQNWRGKPLVSYAAIVSLIAATTTRSGLTVRCELDDRTYPTGRKVTDDEVASVNLDRDAFHGEWNYRIRPRPRPLETVIS